ncbi:MAG: 50S ribosomal protein L11 methyltransferase [Candidatus Latescibacteria bacterium]|nr:50S ribosomal protein L11 methyltransferase [Candidatus Latescibacterota bacterium]
MSEVWWRTVAVETPVRLEAQVSDLLSDLGTLGIVTTGDDPVMLKAYFGAENDLHQIAKRVEEFLKNEGVPGDVEPGAIPDEDWEVSWREQFSAIDVGRRIVVLPPWQQPASDARLPIVINPKMAFGTGSHATTRLSLEAIERSVKRGVSVLDVGAGSGVLSIAAATLGASQVVAVEIDGKAVVCAKENIDYNGVSDRIELVIGSIETCPERRFDLVVANIEADPLCEMATELYRRVSPNGIAVLSGVLKRELGGFKEHMEGVGWRVRRVEELHDEMIDHSWVAVCMTA